MLFEKSKQHFVVLDGMRGIAAIAVAWFHASQLFVGEHSALNTPALAVDFFFCLSGFVVAYAYGSRLDAGMSIAEFAARRAIRLYPMIFLGAGLGGAVLMMGALHRDGIGLNTIAEVASAFLLIPAGLFFGAQAFPTNNPIWSLFFEFVANAVYAKSSGRSLGVLTVVLAASASALVLVSYFYGGLTGIGFEGWRSFTLGFVRVCYPFLAGVLIFRLALYEGLTRIPAAIVVAVLISALFLEIQPTWAYQAALSIVVYPLIVVIGANARPGTLRGVMVWLGNVSYPLYLIHQPILRIAKNTATSAALARDYPIWMMVAGVAACCALATLVFHIYDKKVRNWAASVLLGRHSVRGSSSTFPASM